MAVYMPIHLEVIKVLSTDNRTKQHAKSPLYIMSSLSDPKVVYSHAHTKEYSQVSQQSYAQHLVGYDTLKPGYNALELGQYDTLKPAHPALLGPLIKFAPLAFVKCVCLASFFIQLSRGLHSLKCHRVLKYSDFYRY